MYLPSVLMLALWHKYEPQQDKTNKMTCTLCAEYRHRSAWASAQFYLSLHCPHEEVLGPWLLILLVFSCSGSIHYYVNQLSWGNSFYLFFLFCGCQGGKGDGTDVYIIRDSVHFSLQYEICKMRKFWGQSWSYVISIQKDWKKSLWIPIFKS